MIQFNKIASVTFASVLLLSCFSGGVQATERRLDQSYRITFAFRRATNQFELTIPPKTTAGADTSFSLAAGETVTINASYAPESADMDFGLMDSDGVFHYTNVTDGSIHEDVQIKNWGDYTLAIRNNSSYTVKVSGFVND